MILLLVVFLLVVFFAVIPEFLPGISRKVVDLVVRESNHELDLKRQIETTKAELQGINMVDEFAKYAKAERKLNKLKDEHMKISKSKSEVLLKMKFGANVVFHVVQTICLLGIIWTYRSVPVIKIPQEWLFPLQSIVAFPTGAPGALGLTFWLLVCRSVVKRGMQIFGR